MYSLALFFKSLLGYVVALLRLLYLALIFVVTGIYNIFFNRLEIVGIVLKSIPIKMDRDKVSYIDRLIANNVDVCSQEMTIPPPNAFDVAPFKSDDCFDDVVEDDFSEDDIEDDDEGDENPGGETPHG